MYDILDLYEKPYNELEPVIGFDEKPKQLLEDARKPIPMTPGKLEKYDYEYIRHGKVNIFMAVEPKAGKRIVKVTNRRTKKDFAKIMKTLVDVHYTYANKLHIILDNLNTHNSSSLYETFDKKEAKRILKKIQFHYTPVHASWLNVAEIEISVMDAECTETRIKDKQTLINEIKFWSSRRNLHRKKIDWKFTSEKADAKLKRYYVS